MSADILTFGCRLNAYESEVMRAHAPSGTIVVNTCAVTAEAERQARQAIRRAHRERPDAPIVVTGCAAQIAPDAWAGLPGVSRVLGNTEKLRPESWAAGAASAVSDIFLVRESAKIPGQFILSGRYKDQFKHLLLVDPEGIVSVRKCSSVRSDRFAD